MVLGRTRVKNYKIIPEACHLLWFIIVYLIFVCQPGLDGIVEQRTNLRRTSACLEVVKVDLEP